MNVVVSLEHRFEQTPDGAVWTQTQFARPFWSSYLDVFNNVRVVARVRPVAEPPAESKRADGDGVGFVAVPYYVGPREYLWQFAAVRRVCRTVVGPEDAVVLRVSSVLGGLIHPVLRRTGRPYGVEVVADPYDVFAPGSVRHALRPFFRWWFARQLRRHCAGACAAAYVTEHALQRRYPPGPGAYTTHFSSIELPDAAFVPSPRPLQSEPARNLILVGTLAQLYKAPDVLIDAVSACVRDGLDLRLTVVGEGKHRGELEGRAAALGLNGRVCFRGQLAAGEPVRRALDEADLFVLPSHQEGLPRAMIEAMARGLPCVGSTVGGIPELLPPEDLVPPGDSAALARKLREVATNPGRLMAMSARNLARARDYTDAQLRPRRRALYERVRDETLRWLRGRESAPLAPASGERGGR